MIGASGVGVYLRGILPWFIKSSGRFLLVGGSALTEFLPVPPENVRVVPCAVRPFSPAELLFFPKKITEEINRTDVYFTPFFNIPAGIHIPVFTTIHDIIFPDMPELTSRIGLAARMFFFRRAFKLSKTIFTVSEFSKSRIEYYAAQYTAHTIHSAIQPFYENRETSAVQKKETIVFAGNLKKHKGLSLLLDAFFRAQKMGLPHTLIIVGTSERFRTRDNTLNMTQAGNLNSVVYAGTVSDEELAGILSTAALLVQPSFYEGFGLPPLEAMFCGTQALLSDIPVFKEIYGDFPVEFFKTGDAENLTQKLMKLLYQKEPARITLSPELKQRYTFQKTAGVILSTITAGQKNHA